MVLIVRLLIFILVLNFYDIWGMFVFMYMYNKYIW